MPRDRDALFDVLQACRLVMEFKGRLDQDAFLHDAKTQSAVLHQLLVIGEAVKRLSDAFRFEHPQIPWKRIAGMRDLVIHHYDHVDLEEVWKTISVDVPQLMGFVQPLVDKAEK